jgi:TatD DNase family protein
MDSQNSQLSQLNLGLIDSHAHIQGEEFAGDVEGVVNRAREAGIEKIIVVGGAGDLSSNDAALKLAGAYPGLHATVGMHPHDAKEVSEEDLDRDFSPFHWDGAGN